LIIHYTSLVAIFFLNDLAEAMKALDGKKYIISGDFNQADVAFPDVWNDL